MNETYGSTNITITTSTGSLFYHGLIGLLGSLAILFNGPLLLVLVKSKTPVFRSRMNYLVGSLALADFLTGIAAVFSAMAIADLIVINFTLMWITISASFITILLMSVERLIVLSYPLTWPFILTTRRTRASIAITWCVSLACGLSVKLGGAPAMFVLTTLFEVTIFVVVVLHAIIFGYLRRRRRAPSSESETFDETRRKKMHSLDHVSQSNATTVLLILVVILIFTVLPTIVVLQLYAAFWMDIFPESSFSALGQSHYFLFPIELLNFIANPIVYAWRLKQYRKALAETFATSRLCSFGRDYSNVATERTMK